MGKAGGRGAGPGPACSQALPPPAQGIFVSRIAEGGAAHRAGTLQVGDRVLSVSRGSGSLPAPIHPLGPLAPDGHTLADQRRGRDRGQARPRCLSADRRLPHHRSAAGTRGWGAPCPQPPTTFPPTPCCCHHYPCGHCRPWRARATKAGPQSVGRCPGGALPSGGETPGPLGSKCGVLAPLGGKAGPHALPLRLQDTRALPCSGFPRAPQWLSCSEVLWPLTSSEAEKRPFSALIPRPSVSPGDLSAESRGPPGAQHRWGLRSLQPPVWHPGAGRVHL